MSASFEPKDGNCCAAIVNPHRNAHQPTAHPPKSLEFGEAVLNDASSGEFQSSNCAARYFDSEQNEEFVRRMIRFKVWRIIGRAGLKRQDHEDLESDVFVRVLRSLRAFNPARGSFEAFIATAVDRHIANLLRNRRARKRDDRRTISLNALLNPCAETSTELGELISEMDCEEQRAGLVLDLDAALSELPEDLRTLAILLKSCSLSEIARDMGVPRTTLYANRRRLRKHLEKAGLRDYV